jgi:hypothetical protein
MEIELIQDGGLIKREKDIVGHYLQNNNIGENGEKEALHVESLDL